MKLLLSVLRGEFEVLTVAELRGSSERDYVRDGLCAVERGSLGRSPNASAAGKLSDDVELLQVAHPHGGSSSGAKGGVREVCGAEGGSVCYMLSRDVQELLVLTGSRAHLWALLRQHARHHHADRHFASHVAHVWREEEGYILINAHPGFEETVSLTGIINEPAPKASATMKMVRRRDAQRPRRVTAAARNGPTRPPRGRRVTAAPRPRPDARLRAPAALLPC